MDDDDDWIDDEIKIMDGMRNTFLDRLMIPDDGGMIHIWIGG